MFEELRSAFKKVYSARELSFLMFEAVKTMMAINIALEEVKGRLDVLEARIAALEGRDLVN